MGIYLGIDLGVSKNSGTPKSSILIGFSIINHPFWGTPIFGNTHFIQDQRYPCITDDQNFQADYVLVLRRMDMV